MKLNELIEKLKIIQENEGDIEVFNYHMSGRIGIVTRLIVNKDYVKDTTKLFIHPSEEITL